MALNTDSPVMHSLKILLIDDHQLFADGLGMLLSGLAESTKISHAASSRALLEDVSDSKTQDLIILDLNMPNIDGITCIKALRARGVQTPILVISSTESRREIESALAHGAQGFVPKNAPTRVMLEGVRTILDGGRYVPENLVGPIDWPTTAAKSTRSKSSRQEGLTRRQLDVLNLMYSGNSNQDMATVLGITESAIKAHVSNIFRALEVRSRTACIKRALELGILN